ncbi:serum deprivation-response protein-like [Scleropages formosus]|uniref:Caveolae associated protein 2a n=1 Tax=Scleropages formosus TaxID=113540 RepID=A0A0P7XA03_SCLFO|nr:caveolae-associated protein 2-like [Scleropages formosus]KPP71483.1 serum deprivation-response protein-like [Scleropages formosus]
MGDDAVQAEQSSLAGPSDSQELQVPSPSPAHSLSPLPPVPLSPGGEGGQVNAITVLTLLDKLVHMLDTVQDNQRKMEQRQVEIEGAVHDIQSDLTKLSKCHSSTSNTVNKLLEKSRKVSLHMKEVNMKMDKQAVQVKKLEANHAHLLRRDNFKVLIFQDENEIPSSVFVKDSVRNSQVVDQEAPGVDANYCQEEGMHTISLSSDEEAGPNGEEDPEEALATRELSSERAEWSRAERLKRSSLKKVDTLKKAFSRQSIEKKMNKISTKIVSPEQREKIKKSFTPNHPKSPSSRSSSFKVSALTFNVKKERSGEASPTTASAGPNGSTDEGHPIIKAESHPPSSPEEVKATILLHHDEDHPTSYSACSLEGELSITENGNTEEGLSTTLQQPDQDKEEEPEVKEDVEAPKQKESHVEGVVQSEGLSVE